MGREEGFGEREGITRAAMSIRLVSSSTGWCGRGSCVGATGSRGEFEGGVDPVTGGEVVGGGKGGRGRSLRGRSRSRGLRWRACR